MPGTPTADATRPHVCACGRNFGSAKGLQQHRRRYCKADPVPLVPPEEMLPCEDCDRTFQNIQGLQQHRKQAHPVQYNRGVEEAAGAGNRRAGWSNFELLRMAQFEAAFQGRLINQHLVSRMPGRTLEAIKSVRKRAEYKEMVRKSFADIFEDQDQGGRHNLPPPPPQSHRHSLTALCHDLQVLSCGPNH